MYNFCAGPGQMRSRDICMWMSVCGDMCDATTEKQTNVNSSVDKRSGMEESAVTRASVYPWIF